MPEKIENIPVFIASPSGLDEERQATRRIVSEINRANAKHWGCQFELVGWEETLPGIGRPQGLINQDLDRCEYFIGVMFDHWGSSSSKDGTGYSSGFEEEFERAKLRARDKKLKGMAVYFKDIPSDRLRDPGESLKKVIEFKKKCFDEKDALYRAYVDLADFEVSVRALLTEYGWSETRAKLVESPSKTSQADGHEVMPEPEEREVVEEYSSFIKGPMRDFIQEVLDISGDGAKPKPSDVARLRLISSLMQQAGNDDTCIGAHDANILFASRNEYEWSAAELRELMSSGLSEFGSSNVPLWSWEKMNCDQPMGYSCIELFGYFGEEREMLGALEVLRLFGREFSVPEKILEKEDVLKNWLLDDGPNVFSAAVRYLADVASEEDYELISTFVEKVDFHKRDEILEVLVAIAGRKSAVEAIQVALKTDAGQIGQNLLDSIFEKPGSLHSGILEDALESASSELRAKALNLLSERNAVDVARCEKVLNDPDVGVRFEAVLALMRLSSPVSDDIAKKVLGGNRNARRSLLDFASARNYYQEYQYQKYMHMSDVELEADIAKDFFLIPDKIGALYHKSPKKYSAQIRDNIQTGFSEYAASFSERLVGQLGVSDSIIEDSRKISQDGRPEMINNALRSLCSLRQERDLELVRQVVDGNSVNASRELLSYFEKYGDWSDVARILALSPFPHLMSGSYPEYLSSFDAERGRALLKLAKNREVDLFRLSLPDTIRWNVLLSLSKSVLSGFSDDVLLTELNRDNDTARIILALQCVRYLAKKRVLSLLKDHLAREGTRYYNVTHWLDLVNLLPNEQAKQVAVRRLRQFEG